MSGDRMLRRDSDDGAKAASNHRHGRTLSAWDQLLIAARRVPPPADRSERERPADVPRPHPAHPVRNPTSARRCWLRLTAGSARARGTGRSSRRSAPAHGKQAHGLIETHLGDSVSRVPRILWLSAGID